MPLRIPMQTVIVQRDGKNFRPKIGKPFNFTEQELRDIEAMNPRAIRKVVNEASDLAVAKTAEEIIDNARAAEFVSSAPASQDSNAGSDAGSDDSASAEQSGGKKRGKKQQAASSEDDL